MGILKFQTANEHTAIMQRNYQSNMGISFGRFVKGFEGLKTALQLSRGYGDSQIGNGEPTHCEHARKLPEEYQDFEDLRKVLTV